MTARATSVTVLRFGRDLRLADHPALAAALAAGGAVVPVFVWSPGEEGEWAPGAASRWWLHGSLRSLAESLRGLGSRLVVRRGPTVEALLSVARATGAGRVVWTRRHEPAAREVDARVLRELRSRGFAVEETAGSLLFEPGTPLTREGGAFKVFTPFWRACLASSPPAEPLAAPSRIPGPRSWPDSLPLEELGLLPGPDREGGLGEEWRPGEAGALARLEEFAARRAGAYADSRDRPDLEGTSRLSPHLRFGEIGPRQVWHALAPRAEHAAETDVRAGAAAFLRQLGWREFAHHLLFHFPESVERPMRPEFERFPWAKDPSDLRSWRSGRTGYPIVDAGMRELRATGWMHNRVRMVAASFLVKDLLVPWAEGARWFWDTLVDADLANNTLGWQWVAGCGADSAPYFRVFNPVSQGRKFDPDGSYVRRWVPELAGLPSEWVHRPWEAPDPVLEGAGVRLGGTYPRPVVDHAAARERALAAFASIGGRRARPRRRGR